MHGPRLVKSMVKKTPLIGPIARKLVAKTSAVRDPATSTTGKRDFEFVRRPSADTASNVATNQLRNLLDYTKTSGSIYSARKFPAGYHTIEWNGVRLQGQRDPAARLQQVPVDFTGKTVLDLGANQGGMLHELRDRLAVGIGVDYDHRMVNVANRIAALNESHHLQFYVFDLQQEPLELIRDLVPGEEVDVVFLLAVCMWLDNWREVIDFAVSVSRSMLFESNGSTAQKEEQLAYVATKFGNMQVLAESSQDDPKQKNRRLVYCTDPKR